MPVHPRRPDAEDDAETNADGEIPGVSAYETRPGRVVFTETENADAWIATDLAVAVER